MSDSFYNGAGAAIGFMLTGSFVAQHEWGWVVLMVVATLYWVAREAYR